jgi:hypothetical protein
LYYDLFEPKCVPPLKTSVDSVIIGILTNRRFAACFTQRIGQTLFALHKPAMNQEKAVCGKWTHWYEGDLLINLQGVIDTTKALPLSSGSKMSREDI